MILEKMETHRKKKRADFSEYSGFTLIEIMTSMLVFAIGVICLISLHIQTIRQNSFSNRVSLASTLAQDKMEDIRLDYSLFFFSDYLLQPSPCPPPGSQDCLGVPSGCTDSITVHGATFVRCWTISDPIAPPFDVKVSLNWEERPGTMKNINFLLMYEPR